MLSDVYGGGDRESRLNTLIEDILSGTAVEPGDVTVDLMASHDESFPETVLQDVVRRSKSLAYVTMATSDTYYTCTKMWADGFGGCATLVSARSGMSRSTHEPLAEYGDFVRRTGGRSPFDFRVGETPC